MDVTVQCDAVAVDPGLVLSVASAVCRGEGDAALDVEFVIIGDAESLRVNRAHLGHDWVTDVIAFDYRTDAGSEAGPEGEVFVNAEMAVREATARGHDPLSELLFYVAHGLLHLLGYDDGTDAERADMHGLQRRYLVAAGVTPPKEELD